jgi:hypothetical protein
MASDFLEAATVYDPDMAQPQRARHNQWKVLAPIMSASTDQGRTQSCTRVSIIW